MSGLSPAENESATPIESVTRTNEPSAKIVHGGRRRHLANGPCPIAGSTPEPPYLCQREHAPTSALFHALSRVRCMGFHVPRQAVATGSDLVGRALAAAGTPPTRAIHQQPHPRGGDRSRSRWRRREPLRALRAGDGGGWRVNHGGARVPSDVTRGEGPRSQSRRVGAASRAYVCQPDPDDRGAGNHDRSAVVVPVRT